MFAGKYCIASFKANNCIKSSRKCSSMLAIRFILRIWSWIRTMKEIDGEVEKHSPKIEGISEIFIGIQVNSFLDPIWQKTDVRNESSLSQSIWQILQSFCKTDQEWSLLTHTTEPFYPTHQNNAPGYWFLSSNSPQFQVPHSKSETQNHTIQNPQAMKRIWNPIHTQLW